MQQKTTLKANQDSHTLPELLSHIDGERVAPELDLGNMLRDPNTQKLLQAQWSCSNAQIERALESIEQAWIIGEWENTPPEARADVMDAIADKLSVPEVSEKIAHADALSTGAVITLARRMSQLAPYAFRTAAGYLRSGKLGTTLPGEMGDVEYLRRPWGPALLLSPWNGPTAIGSHKIASALAAGAPCIFKPSEWAPHSAVLMADVISTCDLPRGIFQLTCGGRHAGGKMVSDRRIKAISFTGGTAGGREIAKACAESFTPTQLELSGNNPLVVFEDADLEMAAEGVAYGLSNLNAQWCRALGRLLVHHKVKDALLERVAHKLSRLKLGHSLDQQSQMGPLIHEQQYRSVLAEIERLESAGGKVLQYTRLPELPGYFVPPTLIDGCLPQDTTEEIFGPVASIHSFENDAEALALANGTDYGLAAYVYSKNEVRARDFARKLRTGGVKINGYSLLSLSPDAPRGAWGLSGLGEEGTAQSIEFFTGVRVVGVSGQDPIGA